MKQYTKDILEKDFRDLQTVLDVLEAEAFDPETGTYNKEKTEEVMKFVHKRFRTLIKYYLDKFNEYADKLEVVSTTVRNINKNQKGSP